VELVLEQPPEEVWEALTDAEHLEEWFANEVEFDVRPGGEGRFAWDDGTERRATVERVEPERELVFRWDDGRGETVVAFSLQEVPQGTRLLVTETRVGPSACAGEWALALELKALLRGVALV
jgi:uncharacterized protein YndB with AHSA1/START domain